MRRSSNDESRFVVLSHPEFRELTQQDGLKTQDGRATKICGARLYILNLRDIFSSLYRPECFSGPVE